MRSARTRFWSAGFGESVFSRMTAVQLISRVWQFELLKQIGGTLATRAAGLGLGFVATILTARLLGPEGRGIFALAAAISGLGVQIATLGLNSANTYLVARSDRDLAALHANSIWAALACGGVLAGALFAIVTVYPALVPVDRSMLVLALIWIPIGLLYTLSQSLLLGQLRVVAYNAIDLLHSALGVLAIVVIAYASIASPNLIYGSLLVMLLVVTLASNALLWIASPRTIRPNLALLKNAVAYGLRSHIAALLGFMIMRIDLLMINYFLGSKSAGLYSVAAAMVTLIYVLPSVVGSVLFPRLCAMSEWHARYQLVKKTALLIAGIMTTGVLAAGAIVHPAIVLLFGADYAGAVAPLLWLLPGALVWSIESVARKLLTSDGYRIEVVFGWFVAFVLNVVLNWLLIPKLGLVGAAMASSVSLTVVGLVTIVTIWRDRTRYGGA